MGLNLSLNVSQVLFNKLDHVVDNLIVCYEYQYPFLKAVMIYTIIVIDINSIKENSFHR